MALTFWWVALAVLCLPLAIGKNPFSSFSVVLFVFLSFFPSMVHREELLTNPRPLLLTLSSRDSQHG